MLAYLFQLQNASFNSLSATDFKVAVVDPDDSGMNSGDVTNLQQQGKTLFSYLSIGEAEDYRSYWDSNNWNSNPPDFLLAENPNWPGNFNVKFWDNDWQNIMLNRVTELVQQGYNGMYLDIVDGYQVQQVIDAYDGQSGDIRQDMIDFVIRLSEHAKSLNPDFKVITQNAVELLGLDGDADTPNTAFMDAIDGVGKEDTWTDGNTPVSWTPWDLQYLQLVTEAGKFVLAIDYPTQQAAQEAFIQNAIDAGFIPFVGTRDLDGNYPAINDTILDLLPTNWLETISAENSTTPDPQPEPEPEPTPDPDSGNGDNIVGTDDNDVLNTGSDDDRIISLQGDDRVFAHAGDDSLFGGAGNDFLHGNRGEDLIFGEEGNDTIRGGKDNDTLVGNDGDDSIRGDNDADTLFGNQGNDFLNGNRGNDTVRGGKDDDNVHGGKDDDLVSGDDGNDTVSGDLGNDTLSGGAGADIFRFAANFGQDIVTDFQQGEDILQFSHSLTSNVNDVLNAIDYIGDNTVINLGNDGSITLLGINEPLTVNDIIIG